MFTQGKPGVACAAVLVGIPLAAYLIGRFAR
jgi:hypothetical protein